jgi:hypothetical protein
MALAPSTAGAISNPTVPPAIAVPAGNVAFLVGHARGYQVYGCQAQGSGFAWVLLFPYAGLVDDNGGSLAIHYAGPSWTAADSSTIVGTRVASAPAPGGTAIPWLLLAVTSHSGKPDGTFSPTTYVQRINTSGGLAPSGGCDANHVGATAASYYTADYWFFKAA